MNFDEKVVGKNIRKYRLYNEFNQQGLAKQLGIHRKTLIAYEKGYTLVPTRLYSEFANALNISIENLLSITPHHKII